MRDIYHSLHGIPASVHPDDCCMYTIATCSRAYILYESIKCILYLVLYLHKEMMLANYERLIHWIFERYAIPLIPGLSAIASLY